MKTHLKFYLLSDRLRSIGRSVLIAPFLSPWLFSITALRGQMVSPAIDEPGKPFSYFSQPTDVIGVMDAPSATLVSPEGFFYTGYGELMFFTGEPAVPIGARVKTLLQGYLPVVEYTVTRDGVDYGFEAFAATLDGSPSGVLVDFIRVTVVNQTGQPRMARISSGMRYAGDANDPSGVSDNRFPRPAVSDRPGRYSQPGEAFNTNWRYSSEQNTMLRDGKVLYYTPEGQNSVVAYTLKEGWNEADVSARTTLEPRSLKIMPSTPADIAYFRVALDPHQTKTLDWKLPIIPVPAGSVDSGSVRLASFDTYKARTVRFWQDLVGRGLTIQVAEDKVNDTFKASLVYDLLARTQVGSSYVQTVNNFEYHRFWLRDAANIARMYDLSGYSQYAQECLAFFAQWQQKDGNFVSQGGQLDGIGQTLWIYGQHYQITQDREFAQQVFPAVARAVDWIHNARMTDPLHLMPVTTPGDNENVSGHITGHNFWALDGLKGAITLAVATGHVSEAAAYTAEYKDYLAVLRSVLAGLLPQTGGAIPPGLDGKHAQDWGNMQAIYPELVMDPFDPMVTATLNATRAKYAEGLMTYDDGRFLHHYLTMMNTESEIIRGEQELAVEELYSVLLHTSSTQTGFEFMIRPWGDRDFGPDLAPHGWFAAEYRTTLRNMMVREQGDILHLFSVISPHWAQPGKEIVLRNAPSNFGEVSAVYRFLSEDHAEILLNPEFVRKPSRLVLHLPWFMEDIRVKVDGSIVASTQSAVDVPPATKRIELHWQKRRDVPVISYDQAVVAYKAEYLRRYNKFIQGGPLSRSD